MQETGKIYLEGCENCRDIGRYNTRYGIMKHQKLIRSAQLNNLTQHDLELLKNYGVKKVIDLRGTTERKNEPDTAMNFAENISVPIFHDMRIPVLNDGFMKKMFPKLKLLEEVLLKQRERMIQVYKNFVTEPNAVAAYKKIFQILIENSAEEESILFHCTAGKDRTGFVAALIMSALGVHKSHIIDDYLLTNHHLSGKINKVINQLEKGGVSDRVIGKARGYFMAKEEYLDAAFFMVESLYGSMDEFLYKQIGLTEIQRTMLYDRYINII